jgi:hypothetical protein
MMPFVVLALMVSGVSLALFLNRGRGNAQGCCCPSDPSSDLRMREAFSDAGGLNNVSRQRPDQGLFGK